ncbi:metalloregulator ArsR/SmtB family transcription factor [Serratia rubidaea]|uniref:Metalloregulator ArsR/SmtB family transcription factor n=1 Tax=Serratia rubidaea TaxID=61652 RepID=A0ABS0MBG5_SERRU|nr:metalloregulator ArsR/SmtB family transcription factor [Serratia rubidaea]MBH1929708.1 metalloregulator ArsR/SmtB family transcription factor [Serratia rubidaea]
MLTPLQLFKNLSDETRLMLVLLLRQSEELCVCELAAILTLPQPKISRHLAMLRVSGLLLDRREGKWIYYRLSPHMPAWAAGIIEQAYLSQLEALSRLVKRAGGDGLTLCR